MSDERVNHPAPHTSGDISAEASDQGKRSITAVSSRQEIVFACLECGAVHRILIVNGKPSVTLEREE